MLKSEFATSGTAGLVDHAAIADTSFGASAGLEDELIVGTNNKLGLF